MEWNGISVGLEFEFELSPRVDSSNVGRSLARVCALALCSGRVMRGGARELAGRMHVGQLFMHLLFHSHTHTHTHTAARRTSVRIVTQHDSHTHTIAIIHRIHEGHLSAHWPDLLDRQSDPFRSVAIGERNNGGKLSGGGGGQSQTLGERVDTL